jgi:hypothetical protein
MATIYTEQGYKLLLRLIQHRLDEDITREKFATWYEDLYVGPFNPDLPESAQYAKRFEEIYWTTQRAMRPSSEGLPTNISPRSFDELVEEFRDYDFSKVRDVKVSL